MKFELIHTLKVSSFSGAKLGWSWKQNYKSNFLRSVRRSVWMWGEVTGWLNEWKSFPRRIISGPAIICLLMSLS